MQIRAKELDEQINEKDKSWEEENKVIPGSPEKQIPRDEINPKSPSPSPKKPPSPEKKHPDPPSDHQPLTESELEELKHNEWLIRKASERREKKSLDDEAERKRKRIQAIKKSRVIG